MDDAQEALIRGEHARPSSQGISLHKALTQVLAQNLNNTTPLPAGELIPLEVPTRVRQSVAQLVTFQLVRREQPNVVRVMDEDLVNETSNRFHGAMLAPFADTEFPPVRKLWGLISFVSLGSHTELLVVGWNDGLD